MFLIIGLGNPGKEYEKTKHNAGFRAVDYFVKKQEFDGFAFDKKVNALISQGKKGKEKVMVALPQTFMNKSGDAVKKLISNFQFPISNLILVHDDSDIELGRIKISFGKSSGGHKGVESIIKALKTKEFWRLRIGIASSKKHVPAEKLVLQKFKPEEEKIFAKVVKMAAEAIETMILENPEKAMSLFNK